MRGFTINVAADKTVRWVGVDTGETKVVDISEKAGLIALKIGGHRFWSGIGMRSYAPAHYAVYRIEELAKCDDGRMVVTLDDNVLGALSWDVRAQK